jgi:hypothetical protein
VRRVSVRDIGCVASVPVRHWRVSTRRPNWTAVPAMRSTLPVLRLRLYVVLGSLLAAAAAGVFAFMSWVSYLPPEPDLSSAVPKVSAIALTAAEDYLAGRPARFPVADGIDPDFRPDDVDPMPFPYLSLAQGSWRRELVTGRLVETHSFLVVTAERAYTLTVAVALDGSVATLAAYPTLTPALVNPGKPAPALEYQGVDSLVESIPTPVSDVLAEWAAAYAADDVQALQVIVGDRTAQAGAYRGLGGFTLATQPVIRSAVATVDGYVVRVRLVLSATSADGVQMSTDIDVLVQQPNTTLPKVVAWGPAGTGPSLTKYQNRL